MPDLFYWRRTDSFVPTDPFSYRTKYNMNQRFNQST